MVSHSSVHSKTKSSRICFQDVGSSSQSKEARSSQWHRNTASKAMAKLRGGASLLAQTAKPFPCFRARHSSSTNLRVPGTFSPRSGPVRRSRPVILPIASRYRTTLRRNRPSLWRHLPTFSCQWPPSRTDDSDVQVSLAREPLGAEVFRSSCIKGHLA